MNITQLDLPYRCGPGLDSFRDEYIKIHGWACLLVCIFGSIANILNIVVLTRREMKSPTNMILTGLAVADLLVMLEYIPYDLHQYLFIRPKRDTFSYSWSAFVLFHSIFGQVCHTISIWLTVTLAVWRYIAVAHPQKNQLWCSRRKTQIVILIACLVCPIICLPLFFTTKIISIVVPLDIEGNFVNMSTYNGSEPLINQTLWFVDITDAAKENGLLSVNFWMYSIVIKLIPCFALTILSTRLIFALLKAKKRRKLLMSRNVCGNGDDVVSGEVLENTRRKSPKLLDREKQTDRTTRMLLAVLLLFLLTEFPQGVLGLLSEILGEDFFRTCYVKLGEVMDIVALINSAINFILYCAMSRQFRTTFSQLFCTWKLLGRWMAPVAQRLDNNGHTQTGHTATQVTQV